MREFLPSILSPPPSSSSFFYKINESSLNFSYFSLNLFPSPSPSSFYSPLFLSLSLSLNQSAAFICFL